MTDRYFVDTNVLVYARDSSEPQKHALAVEWMHTLWSQGAGRLSFQVLQEYCQVVTRRLSPGRDLPPRRERGRGHRTYSASHDCPSWPTTPKSRSGKK
jgi:predicted nucleic acid-binding protein